MIVTKIRMMKKQKVLKECKNFFKIRLSLQEKISLTEGVRKLSNEGLSAFVKLVQTQCPSAFEDLDAEKVQVRVDMLDRNTYESLSTLVNKFISSSD